MIQSFRDLEVWQVSMELVTLVYRVTDRFPPSDRYGLTSQLRRAAVSIPANLAEGHSRTKRAYRNHVSIAIGSQAELDTLLEVGRRLKFLGDPDVARISVPLVQTGRMLHGLAGALRRSTKTTRPDDSAIA